MLTTGITLSATTDQFEPLSEPVSRTINVAGGVDIDAAIGPRRVLPSIRLSLPVA
jgi:hypothetical protein